MKVCKIFEWDAAHQLKLPYTSLCNSKHGHTYHIEIELEGLLNDEGMVMDFVELKKLVNEVSFDHCDLNELPYFKEDGTNPTAEHLVDMIHVQLKAKWKDKYVKISRIRVWESPSSWAEEEY